MGESSCTTKSARRMLYFLVIAYPIRSDWHYLGETESVSGNTVLKYSRAVLADFSFEVPSKLKLEFRVGGTSGNSGKVFFALHSLLFLLPS
jgi:hypothetical protein